MTIDGRETPATHRRNTAAQAGRAAVAIAAVNERPLDLAAHEAAVADPRAGAVVSF